MCLYDVMQSDSTTFSVGGGCITLSIIPQGYLSSMKTLQENLV